MAVPDEWEQRVQEVTNRPLTIKALKENPLGTINAVITGAVQQLPILAEAMGATALGTAIAKHPAGGHVAGMTAMSLLEAGWFMEQAEEIGKQNFEGEEYDKFVNTCAKYAFSHGTGSGIIEYLGNIWGAAGQSIKAIKSTLLKRAAKNPKIGIFLSRLLGVGGEGLEEFLQTGSSNYYLGLALREFAEVTGNEKAKELLNSKSYKESVIEAGKRGSIYTAVIGGTGGGVNAIVKTFNNYKEKTGEDALTQLRGQRKFEKEYTSPIVPEQTIPEEANPTDQEQINSVLKGLEEETRPTPTPQEETEQTKLQNKIKRIETFIDGAIKRIGDGENLDEDFESLDRLKEDLFKDLCGLMIVHHQNFP